MLVNALRTLTPLFNTHRTAAQYFEAVEALVWIQSPSSDLFFEALGWDPEVIRTRIDLPLYSDLALQSFEENRDRMFRMHIASAQYIIKLPDDSETKHNKLGGAQIPYPKLVEFAENTLAETKKVLEASATRGESSVLKPGKLIALLDSLEELHNSCSNPRMSSPPTQEYKMATDKTTSHPRVPGQPGTPAPGRSEGGSEVRPSQSPPPLPPKNAPKPDSSTLKDKGQ